MSEANPTEFEPTEFKVLILPDEVEEKIGSIIVPDSKKDADKYATMLGTILAVSPLAFSYSDPSEWAAAGAQKPKAGDRVLFAKYAGVRVKSKRAGNECLIVNDKDVVALIKV